MRWLPAVKKDEALNDSDKTITVPGSGTGNVEEWFIRAIFVKYIASATAGDRQVVVEFGDGSDVIAEARAGAVQAATETRYYTFAHGVTDLTSFRDTDHLTTPIPSTLVLPGGSTIRVYDNNAVAAAADDMSIYVQYSVRTLP